MIDRKHIGHTFTTHTQAVEAGALRFFARAIGETDPAYCEEEAAARAGHPAIPVPPTYLFSLDLLQPDQDWMKDLGINLAQVLHGEQQFRYHRMAYAGDLLHFESWISDIYEKKGGALDFIVRDTRVSNQAGEHVADLRTVVVQRNG